MSNSKFLSKKLFIFALLFLIGLLVHFKSFQLVPYGDDWTFIYDFSSYESKDMHVNINYPGFLSFLTPYGPAILTIGLVYKFFGNTYFVYYLFPLIFKIIASFLLFLTLENISKSQKLNNRITNLFSASLFLVGFTGIQSIDWSMNMNIYLALSIFALGLFFQSKYYFDQKKINLSISFLLFIFAIIAAPTRFTPLIVVLPLIDFVMITDKKFHLRKFLIIKNIIFAMLVYLFFRIGIFGNPGEMNNTGLIGIAIQTFLSNLILSFKIFMHWIGITILPVYPASKILVSSLIGSLFLLFIIWNLIRSRRRWLIIGLMLYFIPLFLMWISSSLLYIENSTSRHLILPFFALAFLIGIIFMEKNKITNILKFIFLILICLHIFQINKIYSNWISAGRGYAFINQVQAQIMSHFPAPITSARIVYLDFDDGGVQQSVVFGLGYRIAVLSGTKSLSLFPKLIADKPTLLKLIKEETSKSIPDEVVINSIAAFQYKNKKFSDITSVIQEDLKKEIK